MASSTTNGHGRRAHTQRPMEGTIASAARQSVDCPRLTHNARTLLTVCLALFSHGSHIALHCIGSCTLLADGVCAVCGTGRQRVSCSLIYSQLHARGRPTIPTVSIDGGVVIPSGPHYVHTTSTHHPLWYPLVHTAPCTARSHHTTRSHPRVHRCSIRTTRVCSVRTVRTVRSTTTSRLVVTSSTSRGGVHGHTAAHTVHSPPTLFS
jgi:hypothetical protein